MDTITAINNLTALAETLRRESNGSTQRAEYIEAAIAQLQGILNTPAVDLTNALTAKTTLEVEKAGLRSELDTVKAELDTIKAENNNLKVQLALLTPPASPIV